MGIKKLEIENFIGLEYADFPKFAPITILSGRTGIGKTTVLQAIRQCDIHNLLKKENLIINNIKIQMDSDTTNIQDFRFYDRPYYLYENDARTLTRNKEKILEYANLFDCNISSITCKPIQIEGLYKLIFERRNCLPVSYQESDTLMTALTLYIKLLSIEKDGVLLIDDFNLFCHPETFNAMLYRLFEAALDRNIQIIMVTSSYEVLDSIVDYFDTINQLDKVAYYRLEKQMSGVFRACYFSGGSLKESLEEYWEIR